MIHNALSQHGLSSIGHHIAGWGSAGSQDNKLKKAVVTGVLPTEYVVLKFVLGDGSEVTRAFAEGKLVAKEKGVIALPTRLNLQRVDEAGLKLM